jgi:hypothetical protein
MSCTLLLVPRVSTVPGPKVAAVTACPPGCSDAAAKRIALARRSRS